MRRSSSYRLFLTKNSEYHVRGSVCFGVRDRHTGRWFKSHVALGKPLSDAYADGSGKASVAPIPMVGEPLVFMVRGASLETSSVLSIEEREGSDVNDGEDSGPTHAVSRRHRRRRVSHDTYEMPRPQPRPG